MPILRNLDVTGKAENRVNMIFLGDGYRSTEIEGAYADHVAGIAQHLFSGEALTEPFGRYENFFNLYRVDLTSTDSGADDPAAGVFRDTALDASYSWDGVTERLLYVDEAKTAAAVDAALAGREGITPDLVLVTVNDTKYGGGSDRYSVVAGGNPNAGELAAHEIGHSFAGLADAHDEPAAGSETDTSADRRSVDTKMETLGRPFDAAQREKIILEIYDKVDPIDAHTPNLHTVTGSDSVFVEVVDPAVIEVRWSVDGTVVAEGSNNIFDLSDNGFGLGTYEVTAFAYDPTDWVGADRDALQQTVHWTVEVPTGASAGDDTLTGTGRSDKILALAGDDAVFAGPGPDMLYGGDGDDRLFGGPGDDLLVGGPGTDRLAGGPGADRFAFGDIAACGTGPARDMITDFAPAEGDVIDLSAIDAEPGLTGDQPFRFVGADAFDSVGGTLRCSDGIVQGDLDGNGAADFEIQLLGTDTLRATDFVL